MKIHYGIVLKHYAPYKQMVSLLDSSLGHIKGIVVHELLSPGSVISYHVEVMQQRYFIRSIEYVKVPFLLASQDILFLHHLLEISFFCIPEGMDIPQVYELLLFVFDQEMITNKQKKKILCVLYAHLGLYFDDDSIYYRYMYTLERASLHDMIVEDIDINIEKNISRWLYQCIRMYNEMHQLKTIHILNEI